MRPPRTSSSRQHITTLVLSTLFVILVFSDTKWMFDLRKKGGLAGMLSGNNDDDTIPGQATTFETDLSSPSSSASSASSSFDGDKPYHVPSFQEAVNSHFDVFWGMVDLSIPTYHPPEYCRTLTDGESINIVSTHSYSNSAGDIDAFKKLLNATMDSIHLHYPNVNKKIFCGSTTCISAANLFIDEHSEYSHDKSKDALYMRRPCVSSTKIVLPDLAEGTPVELWIKHHALNKILSNYHYEHQLQVVSQLLIGYQYGGLVVPVGGIIRNNTYARQNKNWISIAASTNTENGNVTEVQKVSDIDNNSTVCHYVESFIPQSSTSLESLYLAMRFTARSAVTNGMLSRFAAMYPTPKQFRPKLWPTTVDWKNFLLPQCNRFIGNVLWIDNRLLEGIVRLNFGTFSYDTRRQYLKSIGNPGMNVGDEIQGVMGVQFLPYLNTFVERDNLTIIKRYKNKVSSETPTTLFMNAWYGNSMKVWPPPPSIDPVLVSIHTENIKYSIDQFGSNASVLYLKDHAPIGGRDTTTTSLFKHKDILTFLSGCMTMTFKLKIKRPEDYIGGDIYIVDVPEETLKKFVPKHILDKSIYLSHKALDKEIVDNGVMRYVTAYRMLSKYAKARLVITSRLHVAMPSVALGTPVIFVYDVNLPGGGGVTGKSRIKSLTPFTSLIDETNYQSFDWTKLPTMNPKRELFMKLKRSLYVMAFSHNSMISDAAIKFGMVPSTLHRADEVPCLDNHGIRPVDPNNPQSKSVIHLSFAVDSKLFHSYDGSAFSTFLTSLAASNEHNIFVVFILTDGLKEEQRCQLGLLTQIYLSTLKVYVMDMEQILNTRAGEYGHVQVGNSTNPNATKHVLFHQHVTRITMARLLLPELLPCVDKIIWLDLDTTVMSSLAELWNTDVSNTRCGVAGRQSVTGGYVKSFGNMPEMINELQFDVKLSGEGFNAGVLVMDMQALRRSFSNKVNYKNFKYLSDYLTRQGRNDQVILNVWCNGRFKRLDPAWNVFFLSGTYSDPMHSHPLHAFKIFHWTGHIKMWNFKKTTEDDVRRMGIRNVKIIYPKLNHMKDKYYSTYGSIL